MSLYGEFPSADSTIPLHDSDIMRFRDDVVWPAIDRLAHSDFVEDALPGSKVYIDKTVVHHEQKFTLSIDACVWEDEEEGGSGVSVTLMHILDVPDMLPSLLKVAGLDYNDGCYQAALTDRYSFTDDDSRLPGLHDQSYEIYDEEDHLIWSDEEFGREYRGKELQLSEKETELVDELDEFAGMLTPANLSAIRFILNSFGVMELMPTVD